MDVPIRGPLAMQISSFTRALRCAGALPFLYAFASAIPIPTQSVWTGGAGDLVFNTAGNWASGTAPASGNSLTFNNSSADNPITVNGAWTVSGLTFQTTVDLSVGTTPSFTLGSGGITQTAAGNSYFNIPVTLSGTTPLVVTAGSIYLNSTAVFSGTGGITKSGAGDFVFYGSSNTFTGNVSVTGGTLTIAGDGSLGNSANAILLNGGTLAAASSPITLASTRTITLGAAGGTFNSEEDITVAGVIGGTGTLTKANTSQLILNNANTFTGGTTISDGAIRIANSLALQNSTVTVSVSNGLGFSPAASSATLGGLAGTQAFALTTTGSGPVALSVGNNNTSSTYSGVMSGTGSLTKIGNGTLTLSGANTYTGATTVNAGTLSVTGSLATGSALTVNSTGTLRGSGTIGGATTIASGGRLAPGASTGVLTFTKSLTLNSGSTTMLAITSGTRGTGYTAINVGGATLYGGTLTLDFGASISNGTTLDFFQNTGVPTGSFAYVTATGSYTGSFTNTDGVWTLLNNDQQLTFSQSTGDLTFMAGASAIPEPSTYAAIVGAFTLGVAALRRRHTRTAGASKTA